MKLNPSNGNMYDFITHTGNAIKGKCHHDCSYCYMKRWKSLKDVRLDVGELNGPMDEGNFIFIGSSCDMFADDIPKEWTQTVLDYCKKYNNQYLFQSKNTSGFWKYYFPDNTVLCTTIETNRFAPEIMNNSPKPRHRAMGMKKMTDNGFKSYVTIEPIMDFDIDELFELIVMCKPEQVNIGADSGRNNLPEPSLEKTMALIEMLKGFTKIHKKSNLQRLLTPS